MNSEIENIQPFLGRILIEIVRESGEEHVKKQMEGQGVSREFLEKFEIAGVKSKKTPISKGKILKMAPDAFGQAFQDRYGMDCDVPTLGSVVLFIPNESYRLDPNDKYHLIGDCDIVAYQKGE